MRTATVDVRLSDTWRAFIGPAQPLFRRRQQTDSRAAAVHRRLPPPRRALRRGVPAGGRARLAGALSLAGVPRSLRQPIRSFRGPPRGSRGGPGQPTRAQRSSQQAGVATQRAGRHAPVGEAGLPREPTSHGAALHRRWGLWALSGHSLGTLCLSFFLFSFFFFLSPFTCVYLSICVM